MSQPTASAADVPQLITVGRISIDLYAIEEGVSFSGPQTFRKSIGGSPTNVAVAAARQGVHAAVATKVGGDLLGPYALARLAEYGVDTRYVGVAADGLTPVVLAALDDPDDPKIIFHRATAAPDTTLVPDDLPARDVRDCAAFWVSACALAQGTTAEATWSWLDTRDRRAHTFLDLDYRPSFWGSPQDARTAAERAIDLATIVVGNRTECHMALGTDEPDAVADELLRRGVQLAIVKLGGGGVLLADAGQRLRIPPRPITLVCGLGAGDAFGGTLVAGVLAGLPLAELGERANAAGAYVAAQLLCSDAMPTTAELDGFVTRGATS